MSTSDKRARHSADNRHNAQSEPLQHKHPELLFQHSDLPREQQHRTDAVKEAAVLIPLIRENGRWSVLFIRRAENKRDRHSGQVAFPGGRRDPQDNSIIDTALRELHEETGIPGDGIQLLGRLPDYLTISHFRITPVVGVVPWPNTITPQQDEVARVFSIPLDWLRDTDNLEIRARESGRTAAARQGAQAAGDAGQIRRHPVIYYHEYDNELLWGASARMTLNLSQALDTGSIVLPG